MLNKDVAENSSISKDIAKADVKSQLPNDGRQEVYHLENKEDDGSNNYPFNCPLWDGRSKIWSHPYAGEVVEAVKQSYKAWKVKGATQGWSLSTNKRDLKIWRKSRRNKTVDLIKGRCTIPFPLPLVVQEMMCRDSKLKYETNLEACNMLKSYGPGALLEYSLAKTPSRFVAQRDMVMAFGTVRLNDEGSVMVAYKSVDSPLLPPKDEYVRVDLAFAGWIFEPIKKTETLVTTIVDIDVKASFIPGWILNLCNESIGKAGYQLKLFMEKNFKQE